MQHVFFRPNSPNHPTFRAQKNNFPKHLCGLFLAVGFMLLLISIRCLYIKGKDDAYEAFRARFALHPQKPWTIFTYLFAFENPYKNLSAILIDLLTLYWLCTISAEIFSYRQLVLQSVVNTVLTGLLLYVLYEYFDKITEGKIADKSVEITMSLYQVLGFSYLMTAAIYAPHYPVFLLVFRFPLYRLALLMGFMIVLCLLTPETHIFFFSEAIVVGVSICYGILLRLLRRHRLRARRVKFMGDNKASGKHPNSSTQGSRDVQVILRKLSQYGYQALTLEEKRILYESSK